MTEQKQSSIFILKQFRLVLAATIATIFLLGVAIGFMFSTWIAPIK